MPSANRGYRVVWLTLLLLGGIYVAKALEPGSPDALVDAFLRSDLFSNLTEATEASLLHRLDHIARAPVLTRLRTVHELAYGNSVHTIKEVLQRYPSLNRTAITSWFDYVTSFLDTYSHGQWPVQHGSAQVVLNLTALSGLPMIRRSLLAQLTTVWLTTLKRDFPADLRPKLEELVRKLYLIHRESVVQRGVMEYFHISKAGGTTWNAAAKLNGCVRANGMGSHVKGFQDECRWMNQSVYRELTGGRNILWGRWGHVQRGGPFSRTCRVRYDYVASKGFAYTSNEYTLVTGGSEDMYDAHVCPHVVNVVMLRNPLKRMESNIRFIMLHTKGAFVRAVEGGRAAFEAAFCNASLGFWEALGPPITDNYIVRSFLGEHGFHTPLGGIGPEQLSAARDQLLQFDLVLDLEAGEAANDRVAEAGLGWPAALSRAHALDSSVLSVRMHLNFSTCHLADADMEEMKARQVPDMKLYGFGRVVSQLDALWLDMARALGLRPLTHALLPDAAPEEIRCGLLWRGANNSALVQAIAAQRAETSDGAQSEAGAAEVGGAGAEQEGPDPGSSSARTEGLQGHEEEEEMQEASSESEEEDRNVDGDADGHDEGSGESQGEVDGLESVVG